MRRGVEYVRRLLEHVFKLRIKVRLLLLDGVCYSAYMINCLNLAGIKFIMRMGDYGKIEAGERLHLHDKFTVQGWSRPRSGLWQLTERIDMANELFIFVTIAEMSPREIRKMFRNRWR